MGRPNPSSLCGAVIALAMFATSASAGTISVSPGGSVVALTNVSQLGTIAGTADFTFAGGWEPIPVDAYSCAGMTFHTGLLTSILPGVTVGGAADVPQYVDEASFSPGVPTYFPSPAGGGVGSFDYQIFGGVVTFSVPVTQFGLTFSRNGTQHITVWNASGTMLGQVNWAPDNDSAFVGIDTLGVPIAMLAVGNDDLFGGASYDIGGQTIITDSWKWATIETPEPSSLSMLAIGVAAARVAARRRRRAVARP